MKQKLFLETLSSIGANVDSNGLNDVIVTFDTFVTLFVLKFTEHSKNIQVYLVNMKCEDKIKASNLPGIHISINDFNCEILSKDEYKSEVAANCNFPVLVTTENVVIAGLCSICRNIVKYSDARFADLLGFKGACLLAPSEASVWTKFCEIDIIESTKYCLKFIKTLDDEEKNCHFLLPDTYSRFENHMSQPIRAHNVYKIARNLAKENKNKNQNANPEILNALEDLQLDTESMRKKCNAKSDHIVSGIPIKDLNLDHKYAEGQNISIADIILFPCFWMMWIGLTGSKQLNDKDPLCKLLPLTYKWLTTINSEYKEKISNCLLFIGVKQMFRNKKNLDNVELTQSQNVSLYKSDPKRYKPRNRIFTKQQDIENALSKVHRLELNISSQVAENQEINEEYFDWDSMPFEALPEGGQLPKERLARKKDQLESIAKQVIRIAKNGDRIVDFCSGTGHLGIILAYKLPKCQIYLLENKEESLLRARQRVKLMNLTNVLFFQCNLDYFIGDFDIGISLHACGVATDIVLQHCIDRNAKFVSCPCCYGGCHQMPHITYPRSKLFRGNHITPQDYMYIVHCADQAHDIQKKCNVEKSVQGQFCMDVVDTDRKLNAEEHGYSVELRRLYPEDCTPKNRLLIGII